MRAYVDRPNLHPEHIVVQPAHYNGENRLQEDIREIFESVIPELDHTLSSYAQTEGAFVERVHPAHSGHPRRLVQTIAHQLSEHDEVHVTSLLWGALPQHIGIKEELAELGVRADGKTSLIRISGSSGTSVGKTALEGFLPESVLFSPFVLLHDDVVDSAKHAAVLIQARLKQAGCDLSVVSAILTRLNDRQFAEPFENDSEIYRRLVAQAQEAGVVFAVPFYKNGPFLNALTEAANDTTEAPHQPWRHLQRELLDHAILFGQFKWLMGEGLDTDIPGSRILPHVLAQLERHPGSRDSHMIQAILQVLPDIKLRIGSFIPGLVALDENRKEEFFDWVGLTFADRITENVFQYS